MRVCIALCFPACASQSLQPHPTKSWDWAGLAKQAGVLLHVMDNCSLATLLNASTLGKALYRLRASPTSTTDGDQRWP